jgi:hypothetical protein
MAMVGTPLEANSAIEFAINKDLGGQHVDFTEEKSGGGGNRKSRSE